MQFAYKFSLLYSKDFFSKPSNGFVKFKIPTSFKKINYFSTVCPL